MKTKRCLNYFTIADFEREERWLNEMSRRGWNFVSTNGLIYRFEAGQAGEYLYKIELPDESRAGGNGEYERFLTECGLEEVWHFKDWIYLRRRAADGPIETADNTRAQLSLINRASGYAADILCRLLSVFAVLSVVSLAVAALLPEGAAVGEFLRGFGTSVAVTGIVALAVIFTPLVRHLHRRVEALMREITIHE